MKATGDPKKGGTNKLLSMLGDYGSGSDSDKAAQKTADKAKYDYQTKTGFKGDLEAGKKMRRLNEEAENYEYLNKHEGGDVDMQDVNTRRLETRKGSTSGDKERTKSYAEQAALKKSARKSPMKAKGDPVPGADPETEEGQQALVDNAMGKATKTALSEGTTEGMKKYFGGVNADMDAVRLAIRKATSIEGNSDYVKNMRKIASARYPKVDGFGSF